MYSILTPSHTVCAKHARPALFIAIWGVIALVMMMANSASPASAQGTLRVDATDEMREAMEGRDAIPPYELYALMDEGLRYQYEGKEPVEARFLIFFFNAESVRSVVAGEPVGIRPGDGAGLGRSLSEEAFLSFYEEAVGQPFYPAIPALPPPPDLFVDAGDVVRQFGDAWSPELEAAWARALNGITGANTKSGIGIALLPVMGRYTPGDRPDLQVGVIVMRQADR